MTTLAEKRISVDLHPLTPVRISDVVIHDDFWSPKLKIWRELTVHDCFDKFEGCGALDNFDRARDKRRGEHMGCPFYDGLVYEMISGAADYLVAQADPRLEARIESYIDRIAAAQQPDGYLNTYTFLNEPEHRWGLNGGNDYYKHDTYNAGCLIEAGVHYYRATGRVRLLEIAIRQANLMASVIGPPPKRNQATGHSVSEEALVRLYELFQEQPHLSEKINALCDPQAWLKLAEFWIETRGHYEGRESLGDVCQDHQPVFEQQSLEGHAVRAVLMGAGLAALARLNQRPEYLASATRLWRNLVHRRMQITGGVGSYPNLERIAPDYVLPNNAYLETCAAVGAAFFHHNMNILCADAQYADELERALYNGVICGTALSGTTYYYTNPLEATPLRQRWKWNGCPCCPPMFAKIMGALPGYIYATDSSGVYVNLFIGSTSHICLHEQKIQLQQETRYPWDGRITLTVNPDRPVQFALHLRIPGWCQQETQPEDLYTPIGRPAQQAFKLRINGEVVAVSEVQLGYARIDRKWQAGDVVELELLLAPRANKAHPRVLNNAGKQALSYGPLIYCLESVDNSGEAFSIELPPKAALRTTHRPELLGGMVTIHADGIRLDANGQRLPQAIQAIPYFANSNRGPVEMVVWIPEKLNTRVAASHCHEMDSLLVLQDPGEPSRSSDIDMPHMSWRDHQGSSEWVEYTFSAPRSLSSAEVYWCDESSTGGQMRLPESWQIFYRDKDRWVPVKNVIPYDAVADRVCRVDFEPITTSALLLQVKLQNGFSGGIFRWRCYLLA